MSRGPAGARYRPAAVSARELRQAFAGALQCDRAGGHVRCWQRAETAHGTGDWQPLVAGWVNPAMGLAGIGGEVARGVYAVELAGVAARAVVGGWFDRWLAEQLTAGAVRWRGGVQTAPPGTVRVPLVATPLDAAGAGEDQPDPERDLASAAAAMEGFR